MPSVFAVRAPWSRLAKTGPAVAALVVISVAVAFVRPEATHRFAAEPWTRYFELHDGFARRSAVFDSAGAVEAIRSTNVRRLRPALALASELPTAQREALGELLQRANEGPPDDAAILERLAAGGELFEMRTREVDARGKASEHVAYLAQTSDGVFLLGSRPDDSDEALSFHPPLRLFLPTSDVGGDWDQTGEQRLGASSIAYRCEGRVDVHETWSDGSRRHDDCLRVRSRLRLTHEGRTIYDVVTTEWSAAGLGVVGWTKTDAGGTLLSRGVDDPDGSYDVGTSTAPTVATPRITTDAGRWELRPFAFAGADRAVRGNIAPLRVPSDPPVIVRVDGDGDLTAHHEDGTNSAAAWRFHPRGTLLAAPTYDPRSRCIYFGTSAKLVYCLDARGLFRWTFAVRDAVASRPSAADGVVVFGSEDRSVYGVDATTGRLRWSRRTGGPVASSAAAADGIVAIGSDDGALYAFEPATGRLRWTTDLGSPIETPLLSTPAGFVAATYDGRLAAVDAQTGRRLWTVAGDERFESGCVALGDVLYFVRGGRLAAVAHCDGRELWTAAERGYVGPPAVVGDLIAAARHDGSVHRRDRDGRLVDDHRPPAAEANSSTVPEFRCGPTVGDGVLWLTDARGTLWRLGPKPAGPASLQARWSKPFTEPPLAQRYLNVTPVRHGDRAVVLDAQRNIYLATPSSGALTAAGRFGDSGTVSVEPTVADDVLFATAGATLYAVRLPDGRSLWTFDGDGVPFHPAVVAGADVFWMVQHPQPLADGSVGTLFALARDTGLVRWKQPLGPHAAPGGIAVARGTLYLSTPPSAYDCGTGRRLWLHESAEPALGGAALDADATTLFVGIVGANGEGKIRALRTRDGSSAGDFPLGKEMLNPLERPWPTADGLIVPLWSGAIVAFADDRTERWRHRPPTPRFGGITVAGGRVWLTTRRSEVVALAAAAGEVAARYAPNVDLSAMDGFAPRPLIADDIVLAPLTLSLVALDVPPASAP